MSGVDTIKRAFELASSGTCRNVEEIKRVLGKEKFEGVHEHLSGSTIKMQLYALIEKARRSP